jgi:PAS domain S-box-containing protein
LCFVNSEGALVDFNDSFGRAFGYTHEDVPTLNEWWRLAYPDPGYRKWVVSTWDAAVRRAAEEKTRIEPIEYRVTRKNGEVRTLVISGTTIGSDFLATFFDVTERKRAEEELQRQTEELDRYFSMALALFCIADTDGYFRRLNKLWEKTLGYSLDELTGKRYLDFVHPDDLEATRLAASRLEAQEHLIDFVNRYRCKNGEYRWIEWRAVPFGKLIFSAAIDITDRKKAEEKISKLNEELEQRVKKRTSELENKNAELEKLNRLFVGRELRMIELKEKIRALEEKNPGETTS